MDERKLEELGQVRQGDLFIKLNHKITAEVTAKKKRITMQT